MESLKKINWGIIGCGDVTEVKSGPAFSLVEHSSLVAVMRRDADKAKDYAKRHGVPRWYSNAQQLISDPEVNAIYIATPPSSHEEYTIAALAAGKPVYVEKPMATDAISAARMAAFSTEKEGNLIVAHYRRAQPYFQRIREIINYEGIGEVRFIRINLCKAALSSTQLADPRNAWRVDPSVAGGGLFHDLAPHQLDILYWLFGEADKIGGQAINQGRQYNAPDMVTAGIQFQKGILFSGSWNFNIHKSNEEDTCEIFGSKGKIQFSFFGKQLLRISIGGVETEESFPPLTHVQEPMIRETVKYLQGLGPNPCTGKEGQLIMQWIDRISKG